VQCFLLKYIKIVHEDAELWPKHVEPKLWPFWGGGGKRKYTHVRWSAQQEEVLQKNDLVFSEIFAPYRGFSESSSI